MSAASIRSALLHLYPSRWRRRYGAEFRALLDDEPLSVFIVFDVLRGAVEAHRFHPMEEQAMTTRRLQTATALVAVLALLPALADVAAAIARGLPFAQATSVDGSSIATRGDQLGNPMVVAVGLAGALVALLLGVTVLVWRLRTDDALRADLAVMRHSAGLLVARPAVLVSTAAVICSLGLLICVPLVLVLGPH